MSNTVNLSNTDNEESTGDVLKVVRQSKSGVYGRLPNMERTQGKFALEIIMVDFEDQD